MFFHQHVEKSIERYLSSAWIRSQKVHEERDHSSRGYGWYRLIDISWFVLEDFQNVRVLLQWAKAKLGVRPHFHKLSEKRVEIVQRAEIERLLEDAHVEANALLPIGEIHQCVESRRVHAQLGPR